MPSSPDTAPPRRRAPLGPLAPFASLLLVPLLAAGCTSGSALTRAGDDPTPLLAPVEHLELHGLLLLMEDQLLFEPLSVESALDGGPALREHLAHTLGRVGDRRGVSYLNELLADPEPRVRRAAAFALGELGEGERLERGDRESAARALLLTAVEPDREVAVLAVEALGKLGVSVATVLEALAGADLDEGERWARLLPHLVRFDEPALVPLVETALAEDGPLAPPPAAAEPEPESAASTSDVTSAAAASAAATAALGGPTPEARAELRRAAAFALGRNPRPEALPLLRRLLADPDPRIRAWAARALGLVGEPADLARLLPLVEPAAPANPSPGRSVEADTAPEDLPLAPAVQAIRAAAALAERGPEGGSGGGESGPPAAIPQAVAARWSQRLLELLDDPRPHLRLEVLDRAVPWLRAAGPDSPWSREVADRAAGFVTLPGATTDGPVDPGDEASGDRRRTGDRTPVSAEPGAAAAEENRAARALAAREDVLAETAPPPSTAASGAATGELPPHATNLVLAERAAALRALAAAFPERAAPLLPAAAVHGDPQLRAAAAAVAGALPGEPIRALLEAMLRDPAPAVRGAAATALLGRLPPGGDGADGGAGRATPGGPPDVTPAAVAATGAGVAAALLDSDDPGLRATAFGWLEDHPVVPYDVVTRALQRSLAGDPVEASLAGVRALAARATAEPLERGGAIGVLEKLADPAVRFRGSGAREWLVRRAAAEALVEMERPAPSPGLPRGRRNLEAYGQIVQRTRRPRTVEMVTGAGTLRLELDCPAAPRTCINFLQLADQGFYDGVVFHRVVPDFVVQGGDPRGDGLGGPGYTIRDEINPRRYAAGTLGMALAGPHTGGSQFFLTLSPQPHLDGAYTAFGRVVSGHEVLERITRGTEIVRVREVDR